MNTVNQILNNFLQEEEKKVVNELVKEISKSKFIFNIPSHGELLFEEEALSTYPVCAVMSNHDIISPSIEGALWYLNRKTNKRRKIFMSYREKKHIIARHEAEIKNREGLCSVEEQYKVFHEDSLQEIHEIVDWLREDWLNAKQYSDVF